MKNRTINESSFSDIDIIAQESKDFREFVKQFYKEYNDFPKDKDTIKWLKSVYDNRSTDESVINESSVEIGDIVFFPSANSAATVIDRLGRSVTLKLANGKKVKTIINKIKLMAQDGVLTEETAIYKDWDEFVNPHYIIVYLKNGKKLKIDRRRVKGGNAVYHTILKAFNDNNYKITNKVVNNMMDNLGEGVTEAISRDAAYIHGILQTGQDSAQNFIDDNGLDGAKLSDYVKNNRNNIDGYNVKHYISGERGTVGSSPKLRQAFIKKFKKGNKPKPYSFFNEKFDRTHLGILQYAFKDINKINPSEPAYKRLAQMLSKLSKQELQQIIDADIKFISILAKTLLTKNESHFKVGDTVKMLHGGIGVVKSLDKEDGADDEKYYNIELPNGDVMKHAPNELTAESVNEGNAFTGALFKARKEGLTEFEFNGKMYPVHKLEEEKEEVVTESKITRNSLKKIIKEEYYNVKNFMEETYGFTPELGKVYSSLINKSFLKEQEDETIDEYDVENYEDLKEFSKFMNEYTYDINEAEYQGRKVKLGKVMQGDTKKFKVYVKNDKGNVVKVNFGQGGDAKGGTMRIRKDNPKARASFRARHNCDNPGPRHKARYWSCRQW